jgi:hypothetical protein
LLSPAAAAAAAGESRIEFVLSSTFRIVVPNIAFALRVDPAPYSCSSSIVLGSGSGAAAASPVR